APRTDPAARLGQIGEPVLVETLVSESAVEALNEGVLDRLPRADEVELDAPAVGPGVERPASELKAIVADQRRRERPRREEVVDAGSVASVLPTALGCKPAGERSHRWRSRSVPRREPSSCASSCSSTTPCTSSAVPAGPRSCRCNCRSSR